MKKVVREACLASAKHWGENLEAIVNGTIVITESGAARWAEPSPKFDPLNTGCALCILNYPTYSCWSDCPVIKYDYKCRIDIEQNSTWGRFDHARVDMNFDEMVAEAANCQLLCLMMADIVRYDNANRPKAS
jgi:hypothetical protein